MASNLTIALIAGGGVLGGASLGGIAQAGVAWRQRVHERAERRRALKLETYRELLRFFAEMPHVVNDGVRSTGPVEDSDLLWGWTKRFDMLRADLSLIAPQPIRIAADEVQEAWGRMALLSEEKAESRKRAQESAFSITRKDFEEHVWPAIKKLGNLMAEDIDLR